MAKILNTEIRRAIVGHLEADASVTALVPAERIYAPQPPALPAWPHIVYGVPSDTPLRMSCVDGQTIIVAIHAFAKGPGEAAVEAIGAAIAKALDGQQFSIGDGVAKVRFTGGSTLQDGTDANSWRRITNLRIRVLA